MAIDGLPGYDETKHCFMCKGYRLVKYPGSWRDRWAETMGKCPMCRRRTRSRKELHAILSKIQNIGHRLTTSKESYRHDRKDMTSLIRNER